MICNMEIGINQYIYDCITKAKDIDKQLMN